VQDIVIRLFARSGVGEEFPLGRDVHWMRVQTELAQPFLRSPTRGSPEERDVEIRRSTPRSVEQMRPVARPDRRFSLGKAREHTGSEIQNPHIERGLRRAERNSDPFRVGRQTKTLDGPGRAHSRKAGPGPREPSQLTLRGAAPFSIDQDPVPRGGEGSIARVSRQVNLIGDYDGFAGQAQCRWVKGLGQQRFVLPEQENACIPGNRYIGGVCVGFWQDADWRSPLQIAYRQAQIALIRE